MTRKHMELSELAHPEKIEYHGLETPQSRGRSHPPLK
jgi:hypothetical protein